jgi:hypothetical protein
MSPCLIQASFAGNEGSDGIVPKQNLSPLFGIPLELRQIIYRSALDGDGDMIHVLPAVGSGRTRTRQCLRPNVCSKLDHCLVRDTSLKKRPEEWLVSLPLSCRQL